MANPEHLKILKQGVKVWNQWRKENPDIKPDLSGVDLPGADFSRADLDGAELCGARLNHANLRKAVFRSANLSQADLNKADLVEASFYRAILCRTDLRGVQLSRANLYNADLWRANVQKANLEHADLRYCDLNQTNFTEAMLTGAKLYGTGRDDWIIKDVDCEYVYWDETGKERSPKDRDLEAGEFEGFYAALPTIEYIFENGMTPIDPLIMDRVVQAIRERRPQFDIKIDSINTRGLAPSIEFTVQHEDHKEPALKEVRKGYDQRIARLEAEKGRLYDLLGQAIDKAGDVKLITAGPGAVVATDGSAVNIQQHISNALELQKAITAEPEQSESFAKIAKKTALDIIGGAIKDIAKGQVTEAAKQIIELGKDLGPLFVRMAPLAYEFFSSIGT